MPTDLGRSYPLDWRGDPPHMLQADIPIWWRFLEKYGQAFQELYYDCLLGGPYMTPQELQDPYKKSWRILNSKRADAIAELDHQVWIIEVAKEPGLRAIGQVQVYRALWTRDPKIPKPEKCVLVADRINPDLLDAAGIYGVLVFIV